MALENTKCFSLVPLPTDLDTNPDDSAAVYGADPHFSSADAIDDSNKTPRLPRWTQQEIFILIHAKREAENRVRRGRSAAIAFGSVQPEPKWAVVSSFCNKHGVNRGPVQCRKRWSNLTGDFKKVKEWESGVVEEGDSFWCMRSDVRREKKLPGSFDRDVYNVLNGATAPQFSRPFAIPQVSEDYRRKEADAGDLPEVVFDSGRSVAVDDGLFSDFEPCAPEERREKEAAPPQTAAREMDIDRVDGGDHVLSEEYQRTYQKKGFVGGEGMLNEAPAAPPLPLGPAAENGGGMGSASGEERKRKRAWVEVEEEEEGRRGGGRDELIQVLERNGRMLGMQMEAQNENWVLEMEQRRGQVDSLIHVMGKLADALGRIADKM